jgi:hypothetical protein
MFRLHAFDKNSHDSSKSDVWNLPAGLKKSTELMDLACVCSHYVSICLFHEYYQYESWGSSVV